MSSRNGIAACLVACLSFGALDLAAQASSSGQAGMGATTTRRFAILVGINQYSDPGLMSLQKAQNDAEDLGRALSRLGGFKSVTVMSGGLPYNDVNFPSRNKIIERAAALAEIVKPEDQVLFFFSGHGVNDASGESYLLPIDAQIKDPTGTGIDLRGDIIGPLEAAGVKNVVCLIDACQKTVAKDKGLAIVGVNEIRAGTRAVVITATGKGKASYEDPKGANGLFTRGILAALDGEGDLNRDGSLSVDELERYLPDAVSEYAFNVGMSQKPGIFDGGNGSLQPALVRLASAPAAAPRASGGADPMAAAAAAPTAKAQFVQFKLPEGVRADLRLLSPEGRELRAWADTSSFSEKLEPGSYRIEAQDRSYLYYPFSAAISVGASKIAVSLDLKPNFGSLSLSCDPPDGVEVLLNGETRGATKGGALAIDRLKSGSYELVLSRELYDTKRMAIQIEDGKVAQVRLALSPNFFTLSVSEKGGMAATLFIDGQNRGTLPQTLKLPFRNVSLRVVPLDPRYKEWSDSVTPAAKSVAEKRVAALQGRTGTLELTTDPDTEAWVTLTPLGDTTAQGMGYAPLDCENLIGDYKVTATATVNGKKLAGSAMVSLREGQTSPLRLQLKDERKPLPYDLLSEKPSATAIAENLKGFPYDASKEADFDEARAMLSYLGAEQLSFDRPERGYVSALFFGGVEITVWPKTYGRLRGYGLRFGVPDATHSYFGSNDTYVEMTKPDRAGAPAKAYIAKPPLPDQKSPSAARIAPADMVLVPGGSFSMGTTLTYSASDYDVWKPHAVTVSAFAIAKFETTVADFRAFAQATGYKTSSDLRPGGYLVSTAGDWKDDASWKKPYIPQTDQDPVVLVSYWDAIAYCNWRSQAEGKAPAYRYRNEADFMKWPIGWNKGIAFDLSCDFAAPGYRLPTEAEWEYAARGGSSAHSQKVLYVGGSDVDSVAWYKKNSGGGTHPVGQKKANALGIYDMNGNALEWCWDRASRADVNEMQADPRGPATGDLRQLRGGAWSDDQHDLRIWARHHDRYPYDAVNYSGFRIAASR